MTESKSSRSSDQSKSESESVVPDLGVPMLPGDPSEPVGPEDALGEGAKRGDYRTRLGDSNYNPHRGAEAQAPHVENIGDEKGKGGVTT